MQLAKQTSDDLKNTIFFFFLNSHHQEVHKTDCNSGASLLNQLTCTNTNSFLAEILIIIRLRHFIFQIQHPYVILFLLEPKSIRCPI